MVIPYGTRYRAEVSGRGIKTVSCESCGTEYVYTCVRAATGAGDSKLWLRNEEARQEAAANARMALERELQEAVELVACPECGWFQKNMVKAAKRRPLGMLPYTLGAAMFAFFGPVAVTKGEVSDVWAFTGVGIAGVLVGMSLLICLSWYLFHNPNRPQTDEARADRAQQSVGIVRCKFEAYLQARQPRGANR